MIEDVVFSRVCVLKTTHQHLNLTLTQTLGFVIRVTELVEPVGLYTSLHQAGVTI